MQRNLIDMASKPEGYYDNPREDMLKYIPQSTKKSLEFGCGYGGFSALLKNALGVKAWAIEIEQQSAKIASQNLDKVINSDALESLDKLTHFVEDLQIY